MKKNIAVLLVVAALSAFASQAIAAENSGVSCQVVSDDSDKSAGEAPKAPEAPKANADKGE